MKDIAEAAGVAQSTVSRILNDAPVLIRVSDETRQRVRSIAAELGYQPHPFARALRGAPSMLLGAVVRDITDPFFAGAVESLSLQAKVRGYSVVLGHAQAAADEAVALTAVLEARQCDAIVLLGDLRDEPRLFEDLRSSHVRVVALWHGSEGRRHSFPTVSVDNRAGVRAAMTHLLDLGHRRIAFVGPDQLGDIRERQGAYEEYLGSAHIPLHDGYVRHVPNGIEGGERAVRDLIALSEPPTAILAATDILAMGVIHGAFESGVAVPDRLSIVGFDDIPIAAGTVPSLTTVKMPTSKIIAAGIELAVGERPERNARVVFKPKLIVRRSTAPAART
ncbi:MAG: LacI family DNA-binding transcriptional regulator [Solirubrobacteraceae bacterium]|jgi:DNA-binding LacI/PurR family transcriptional regulator